MSRLAWSASTDWSTQALIERFCAKDDLASYDPYDIWKTRLGFRVKDFYNNHQRVGLLPAGVLAGFDLFVNNRFRLGYRKQEHAVVRAFAALCLLNLYQVRQERRLLDFASRHLDWLTAHSCTGYSGPCWGLGFDHAVSSEVVYDANTPFSTITPYALEAFVRFRAISGTQANDAVIRGILRFFDRDLCIMEEDGDSLATSYGPRRDRIVINAVSYTMYAYALLLPFAPMEEQHRLAQRIGRLYQYVRKHQRPDGSWYYSPRGRSFIDCFHTCIVLKNVLKTNRLVPLAESGAVIDAGYAYLKRAFFDPRARLFRRFSISNKPGLVRYDLYDNAEALQVATLTGDSELASTLGDSIQDRFMVGQDIYSQIDWLGVRRNRNTLRWAVMPLLYALSLRGGTHADAN